MLKIKGHTNTRYSKSFPQQETGDRKACIGKFKQSEINGGNFKN